MIKNKVIVIVGPTAVGKTKLGVELALRLNGEIISGDSMQIYKEMDIGTAKVTPQETKGIPHHLIDIKNFDESYSVSEFQKDVRRCINTIHEKGKNAIIVGGTGLYIKAALYDYEFAKEEIIDKKNWDQYSDEQLYEKLKKIDIESALKLHPKNRRRVIRAIEIFEQSGITKSTHINQQKHRCLYDVVMIGLTLPRDELYERINQRVEKMFELGLLDEFDRIYKKGAIETMQSMKAIGYKELFELKKQNHSLSEVRCQIQQHSRQYAKRQYTWFKNQMNIHWIKVNIKQFDNTITESLDYIKNYKFYKHLTFKYNDEDLKPLLIDGVNSIKIGHSEGKTYNPTLKEIKTGINNHMYLADIYYNENKISYTLLIKEVEKYINPLNIVQKKEWTKDEYTFEKFYEIKEVN